MDFLVIVVFVESTKLVIILWIVSPFLIYNFLLKVKTTVQSSLSEACVNESNNCTVNFEAKCEELVSSIEEESNQIVSRKKRSVPHKNININFKLTGK